jgi:chromosome segregation ATPase
MLKLLSSLSSRVFWIPGGTFLNNRTLNCGWYYEDMFGINGPFPTEHIAYERYELTLNKKEEEKEERKLDIYDIIGNKNTEISQLQNKLDERNQDCDNYQEEILKLQNKLDRTLGDYTKLNSELNHIRNKLDIKIEEFENCRKADKMEMEKLRIENTNLKLENSHLHKKLVSI